MIKPRKLRIGEVLLDAELITTEQLEQAVEIQKKHGGKLGDILIGAGFITEVEFLRALSNQLNLPFIELQHYSVKPKIIRKLPERIARRFKALVLDYIGEQYLVGLADPTDVLAYDEVSHILNAPIRVAIVKGSDLLKIIDQVYRRTEDIVSFAEALKVELNAADITTITAAEEDLIDETAPVAKMLESIFADAVQVGASDIHIEPDEKVLRIRQRVDGLLQEDIIPGRQVIDALVLRIKLIAKLNISEKRVPQDGRFHLKIKDREIDVRVSTMPVQFGESVVMRLLDQSQGLLSLNKIGMVPHILERIQFFIKRPHGLILLTGPTGSGKSTTLYAILNELNDRSKKIITIEDPIEYTLPRVNQVQVNPTIDLTFARVLRAALRQDPEIVMIGEMRDEETARIGLRAALTGHLVLSTLHTNDSISSAMRLLDMGAEGYLVAAALRLVVAQRLVRKLCDGCKITTQPTEAEAELLRLLLGTVDPTWQFKKGQGCSRCNNTGCTGRIGVHELLEIDHNLSEALRAGDSNKFADAAAKQKNFKPLAIAAFEYALAGVTSLEEVFRIAGEVEDIKNR
jgi:MSHA biogenesis protein MshE